MNTKPTHQEIFYILKRGRQDVKSCLRVLEKYGGTIQDIFRHYPVITAVIPLEHKYRINEELHGADIKVRVNEGITLHKGIHPYPYTYVKDRKKTPQMFERQTYIHRVAQWYAFQFERKQWTNTDFRPVTDPFYPHCITVDGITYDRENDSGDFDAEHARLRSAKRLIQAHGSRRAYAFAFTLDPWYTVMYNQRRAMSELLGPGNFYVYLVYNLKHSQKPKLVQLNSMFLLKHGGKVHQDNSMRILKVRKGVRENNISIHELTRYTESIDRLVEEFSEYHWEEWT